MVKAPVRLFDTHRGLRHEIGDSVCSLAYPRLGYGAIGSGYRTSQGQAPIRGCSRRTPIRVVLYQAARGNCLCLVEVEHESHDVHKWDHRRTGVTRADRVRLALLWIDPQGDS